MVKVNIKNTSPFPLPSYASEGSAGCDLRANITEDVVIPSFESRLIPTGIYIALPDGYEAQIRSRSGLTLRHGIVVANGIGTIDSDYRGEIKVILYNQSKTDYTVTPGERISQMVIARYEKADFTEVTDLDETDRGEGGFGHSGKK
ncbi:MAG: dUTP diphosphatase [Eubacteriaceae bacterium]|nr:dUTP diphosphatase [Eubacteriaceae bacterium]